MKQALVYVAFLQPMAASVRSFRVEKIAVAIGLDAHRSTSDSAARTIVLLVVFAA